MDSTYWEHSGVAAEYGSVGVAWGTVSWNEKYLYNRLREHKLATREHLVSCFDSSSVMVCRALHVGKLLGSWPQTGPI